MLYRMKWLSEGKIIYLPIYYLMFSLMKKGGTLEFILVGLIDDQICNVLHHHHQDNRSQ